MVVLALIIACVEEPREQGGTVSREESSALKVQFADVSAESGLDFINVSGSSQRPKYILETQSAGVAFLDYDTDGFLDVFVVNGTRLEEEP